MLLIEQKMQYYASTPLVQLSKQDKNTTQVERLKEQSIRERRQTANNLKTKLLRKLKSLLKCKKGNENNEARLPFGTPAQLDSAIFLISGRR